MSRSLDRVVTVEDMRRRARRSVPRIVLDSIEGGGGDELTIAANRDGFRRIWFRPRALVDVSTRDLTTTVLGNEVSMPLLLDPCGFARMAHRDAELAVARAASRAGTIYAVTSETSWTLEQIADAATSPLWYQLYLPQTRAAARERLARVSAASYDALCVTIDTPVMPTRDRDLRNGLSIPLRLTPGVVLAGLSRPRWARDFALGRVGHMTPVSGRRALRKFSTAVLTQRPVTLEDIAWLREEWPRKLVVKGIQSADRCDEMLAAGVDAFVVSNHGGRNLDGLRATIDVLPEVVAAVDGRAEVLLDGGVRRGSDVVKALALGARACLIGRPYLFGLAAAGEQGVLRILELLRSEIDQTMAFLGCTSVSDIDATLVARA